MIFTQKEASYGHCLQFRKVKKKAKISVTCTGAVGPKLLFLFNDLCLDSLLFFSNRLGLLCCPSSYTFRAITARFFEHGSHYLCITCRTGLRRHIAADLDSLTFLLNLFNLSHKIQFLNWNPSLLKKGLCCFRCQYCCTCERKVEELQYKLQAQAVIRCGSLDMQVTVFDNHLKELFPTLATRWTLIALFSLFTVADKVTRYQVAQFGNVTDSN